MIFTHTNTADRDYRFFNGDVQGLKGRVERMAALTMGAIDAGEAGVAANLAEKVFQAARSLERAIYEERKVSLMMERWTTAYQTAV